MNWTSGERARAKSKKDSDLAKQKRFFLEQQRKQNAENYQHNNGYNSIDPSSAGYSYYNPVEIQRQYQGYDDHAKRQYGAQPPDGHEYSVAHTGNIQSSSTHKKGASTSQISKTNHGKTRQNTKANQKERHHPRRGKSASHQPNRKQVSLDVKRLQQAPPSMGGSDVAAYPHNIQSKKEPFYSHMAYPQTALRGSNVQPPPPPQYVHQHDRQPVRGMPQYESQPPPPPPPHFQHDQPKYMYGHENTLHHRPGDESWTDNYASRAPSLTLFHQAHDPSTEFANEQQYHSHDSFDNGPNPGQCHQHTSPCLNPECNHIHVEVPPLPKVDATHYAPQRANSSYTPPPTSTHMPFPESQLQLHQRRRFSMDPQNIKLFEHNLQGQQNAGMIRSVISENKSASMDRAYHPNQQASPSVYPSIIGCELSNNNNHNHNTKSGNDPGSSSLFPTGPTQSKYRDFNEMFFDEEYYTVNHCTDSNYALSLMISNNTPSTMASSNAPRDGSITGIPTGDASRFHSGYENSPDQSTVIYHGSIPSDNRQSMQYQPPRQPQHLVQTGAYDGMTQPTPHYHPQQREQTNTAMQGYSDKNNNLSHFTHDVRHEPEMKQSYQWGQPQLDGLPQPYGTQLSNHPASSYSSSFLSSYASFSPGNPTNDGHMAYLQPSDLQVPPPPPPPPHVLHRQNYNGRPNYR